MPAAAGLVVIGCSLSAARRPMIVVFLRVGAGLGRVEP
jgi:hypothetical protein